MEVIILSRVASLENAFTFRGALIHDINTKPSHPSCCLIIKWVHFKLPTFVWPTSTDIMPCFYQKSYQIDYQEHQSQHHTIFYAKVLSHNCFSPFQVIISHSWPINGNGRKIRICISKHLVNTHHTTNLLTTYIVTCWLNAFVAVHGCCLAG